jgi:hypothetical protein
MKIHRLHRLGLVVKRRNRRNLWRGAKFFLTRFQGLLHTFAYQIPALAHQW